MKNYNQKDGMLMIFRAIIMTIIALVICFVCYKIYKPKAKIDYCASEFHKDFECNRDICEVEYLVGNNGEIIRIK